MLMSDEAIFQGRITIFGRFPTNLSSTVKDSRLRRSGELNFRILVGNPFDSFDADDFLHENLSGHMFLSAARKTVSHVSYSDDPLIAENDPLPTLMVVIKRRDKSIKGP